MKDFIEDALAQYGATLSKNGHIITKLGQVTPVRPVIKRGRLRMEGIGHLLFSGPPTAETVCEFVESYWYWVKNEKF